MKIRAIFDSLVLILHVTALFCMDLSICIKIIDWHFALNKFVKNPDHIFFFLGGGCF